MSANLKTLLNDINPYQDQLVAHSLYEKLSSFEHLKMFMGVHVFAVWDFMNLLTTLQTTFTSVSVPWLPPEQPQVARLINEIKLEEESDYIEGEVISHFQYYVKSMGALQIPTEPVEGFIARVREQGYQTAVQSPETPGAVQAFLGHTLECIEAGPVAVAASFTFGRETLIPGMFVKILEHSHHSQEVQKFKTYLERHIELDGEEHGDLATELVKQLCGDDEEKWRMATEYAVSAIQARIDLYSRINEQLS